MTPRPPAAHPPASPPPPARGPVPRRPGVAVRALRGFSGVVAGGLVALALTVVLVQWLASSVYPPGPGGAVVAGHLVGALAAVAFQVVADRSAGRRAVFAALAVLVVAVVVLWFGWWR